MSMRTSRRIRTIPAIVAILLGASIAAPAQQGAQDGEWRYYGGDSGSTKYSPLDQIDRDTVADLDIAWRWRTDNLGPRIDFNYQATPLAVGTACVRCARSRRARDTGGSAGGRRRACAASPRALRTRF